MVTPMTDATSNQKLERLKFARQQLEKERAHRRDKVWKIFSWSGTLLVTIIGGTVALKTDSPDKFELSWWLRGVLIASVVFLMAYASVWIEQNLAIERTVRKAIDECDNDLGIKAVIPDTPPRFGYTQALLMLAIAAIIAIVVPV
jgi:hypothetical protein